MRRLFLVAAAATAVLTWPHFAFVKEFSSSGEYHGGFDVGPLGQCFNPPDCGRHKDIYAQECPVVRERVVTSSGHVSYHRHHVCQ
jgi:hypothetical protein